MKNYFATDYDSYSLYNCSKYRFNRLLTKDPSEVTSLEYK